MPKKKDKKTSDALMITLLFLIGLVAMQVVTLLQLSINGTVTVKAFQDQAFTQLMPFLLGYFIALIYVSKKHS